MYKLGIFRDNLPNFVAGSLSAELRNFGFTHRMEKGMNVTTAAITQANERVRCSKPNSLRELINFGIHWSDKSDEPHGKWEVMSDLAKDGTHRKGELKMRNCHRTVPIELLQIRIFILEKTHHVIARRKVEIELPSDFEIHDVLDLVEDKIKPRFYVFRMSNAFSRNFDEMQIYYSAEPIRSRRVLRRMSIPSTLKTTLNSIANGRNRINFVVAVKGVCVLENDPTSDQELRQQIISAV
uniref:Twinfilin-1 n=1 Tax=Angiostrongylus cantonensis TaxID=6313 RepID=A0A0K0D001_ANGCA